MFLTAVAVVDFQFPTTNEDLKSFALISIPRARHEFSDSRQLEFEIAARG
jgi:hypothetical protein